MWSPTAPVMGPPTGVEPRNATAVSASSRPRMSGGLSCWVMPLPALMNAPPPTPSGSDHTRATTTFGAHAIPMPAMPSSPTLTRYHRVETHDMRAVSSEPTNEPTLVTESTTPNQTLLPQRSSASFGSATP